MIKRKKRHIGNDCLLKMLPGPELIQSLAVEEVRQINHISFSCVTSDWIWISDNINIILINKDNDIKHRIGDAITGHGIHTVNSESELIYINRNHIIKKLSVDLKTTITYNGTQHLTQKPRSVYWSEYTKDLLVGICKDDTNTGKIIRFNQNGRMTQIIQQDNTGHALFRQPFHITDNSNRNIVVSDCDFFGRSGALVVIEHEGKYRFSYTGQLPELWPRGICTDALSNILVCDDITHTVQIINKDGQFLSHLLIRPSGIFRPCTLSYDINTQSLWVGSQINSNVFLYRYITGQDIAFSGNSNSS